MATKNRVYERLEDESETLERVAHDAVQQALDAEASPQQRLAGGSPFSIASIRSRLFTELVSTGGRRGRRDAFARTKIPLTSEEWEALDEIAALIRGHGVNATAGQVAGVILHQSMTQLLLQRERERESSLKEKARAKDVSEADLEETLDTLLAAAASATDYLEQLRPVAKELLRRMKSGKGVESDDEQ